MAAGTKLSAAELRRKAEQYASRFDILDDAWTGVLSKLEQRQSLHEAFRGPAERGTHQAGVGTIVNAPECIAAMEATFVHAPAVTSAADMRALFRNLFHVFDVTGSGRVDYREIVCAMEFCSEPWDAQPLALMTRWYRFYEGGLAGLHFQDFVKMMLTLAVNKDEAQAILKRLSRELIVRVAMEVPIRLGGLKAGSDPHSANARAGDSLLPQVDMYAGIPARRADARFRLRTQEHALAKLRLAVKLGIAERHFDSTSTAKAWRRWQAGCEVVRHERLAMEAASLITGRQISSMEDVAVVAGVVDAEAAAREAAKQQESMAMAGFFEEADFAAQIEEELSAEEERARRMRAQKLDMQRAASLRQRGLSRHAAWLTKLEKDSAQRVRAKVEEVRSAALEAVGEVLPLADDWAEVIEPDFQTAGLCRAGAIGSISFEQLGTSLVEKERPCARAPTEERHATAGSERTAPSARSLVTSSDAAGDARGSPPPASRLQAVIQEHPGAAALAIAMVKVARTQTAGPLRQPLSEWVVETDGVEGVTGFLNTVSAERIHQERMSAVDVLDVACGHLVGGACAAARSLQLESEEAALRASVADRISSLLGREFRRQRARAVALEQARQAVEEQVDPSTGQLVYFNSSTREPLAKKPTMFGKGPVWPRPDWQLRVEPATGVAFYEHRTSPWRSRRQPPRGFPLCFNCQVQLADRRCLGPECNGYLFCWDCWSTHHPAASAEYSAHAVRRLGASALKCDRCAAGTLRGARFIVWAPGYPAICTACKVLGGHADEELVVF
ncbi:hypothetical protein FNF31_04361 [Cafeteria roenbergensis]|uniref:EF-hand domain-containing protein n=1 Tax=Cafeteria roenbergensis TaxID=33653 RepID=A0A5A8D6U3_CAFRO|nr:hypothetical protein FNF31_04361 [Cafeteria roenbergensis]